MQEMVELKERSYPIIMEQGAIDALGSIVSLQRKVMIFKDPNVPDAFAQRILRQCREGYVYTLCEGEAAKSIAVYEACLSQLLQHRFSRHDLIVALGGGVCGDLSGFVAASYMRGIDFVIVPTTTLSQIDSSIGGKVAINLNGVKNCVGAFYQPKAVIIDWDTLKTLPKRQWYNGMVEAWKTGLIQDPVILDLMEQDVHGHLEAIVHRCLLVKKRIVEQDETEQGLRKILNFGHTVGHGIESYYELHDVLHGEAVANGMMKMLQDPTLRKRTARMMAAMNINTDLPYEKEQILAYMKSDKKGTADGVDVVLVEHAGAAVIEHMDWVALEALL